MGFSFRCRILTPNCRRVPWGNELIEQFAEAAIAGEKLGQRGATDLLTISFSSNDYVGHAVGPNAPEVRDMAIRTDQLLGKLFEWIDKNGGMKDTVVVLSADHGVAATPQHAEKMRVPGGYVSGDAEEVVQNALTRSFGKGVWLIPGAGETSLYLNWETVRKARSASGEPVEEDDIYRVAIAARCCRCPVACGARVYARAVGERCSWRFYRAGGDERLLCKAQRRFQSRLRSGLHVR